MNDEARKLKRPSQMERARAARAIIDAKRGSEELALEGFMAIFHPEYAADRTKMLKLKAAGRVTRR